MIPFWNIFSMILLYFISMVISSGFYFRFRFLTESVVIGLGNIFGLIIFGAIIGSGILIWVLFIGLGIFVV